MFTDFTFTLAPGMSKSAWGSIPRRPTPRADTLSVHAARNEIVGAQVIVSAPVEFILTTDTANWLHPLGFTPRLRVAVDFPDLPAGSVEIFPVRYLAGDDRRQWPEALDRGGWLEVPAHRPQPVYLRLRIPPDLTPGDYTGTVTLFAQQGWEAESVAWQGTIALQVHAATLPDTADWSFWLDLWQHYSALARQHRVQLWSDAHFALIDRYMTSLAGLGQKVLTVIATEIPWSGQRSFRDPDYPSPLWEHAIVEVFREEGGALSFDYAHLDQLLALGAKHNIDREIEIFGLLNIWQDEEFGFGKVVDDAPDAIRIRCLDRATGAVDYLRHADELRSFIRGLHDHLEGKGLLDRVRIVADEPSDLAIFNERLNFVQESAPGFRYKVAINHFEFMEDAPAAIVDAVPVLPLACQDPDLTDRLTAQLHERRGKMLWYVCCWPPIPNTFLHSPLPEGQLHGWLTFYLKLDGFLRWAFCLWPADPWRSVSWRAPDWSAGDMYFVLPGPDGEPVETLRYEAMRRAIQDYELLKLAERTLSAEKMATVSTAAFAQILRTVDVRDFAGVGRQHNGVSAADLYSTDPEDYERARQIVLDAVDAGV
jgi:hypothetical protein